MTSPQGRTRQLNFYRVGARPRDLVLVDAPGYGRRGRPEWGRMLDDYLSSRAQSVFFHTLLFFL